MTKGKSAVVIVVFVLCVAWIVAGFVFDGAITRAMQLKETGTTSLVVAERNATRVAMGFPKDIRLNDCTFESMDNLQIFYTVMGSDNEYGISCEENTAWFFLSDGSKYFVDIRATNSHPAFTEPVYFVHTVKGEESHGESILFWYPTCIWDYGTGKIQEDGGVIFTQPENVSLTCQSSPITVLSVIQITPVQ